MDLCRKKNYKVEIFLFRFFLIMFFGRNLTVERWGGMIFWLEFPMGWTIIFFGFFEKSCHYVLWGKITFFQNWISNGVDELFFKVFFQKKCHYILWGKWTFFENGICNEVKECFLQIFLGRCCRYILQGKHAFLFQIGLS